MTELAMATMALFGGADLDDWMTIAGQWTASNEAMVCTQAPASIRSTYESDHVLITFEYRRSSEGVNRMFLNSKMTTGGTSFLLTPRGVVPEGREPASSHAFDDDRWIYVAIEAPHGSGEEALVTWLQTNATADDGNIDPNVTACPFPTVQRGFIRFEATKPGLEIRKIHVIEAGFTNLFDDTSLDGWEIVRPADPDDPGWVNDDGEVRCRSRRSSWLRTLRTYDDFVLRLEYKIPPAGNSGVFLRAPIEGRVSRIGMEVQLLDDLAFRGEIKPAQHCGSIYDGIAPQVRVPAPANAWNAIEVLCHGKRIRTTLNSIELYDAMLDNAELDTNSHRRPLATRRTVGFIGLQDHAWPVRFRRVRIKELTE